MSAFVEFSLYTQSLPWQDPLAMAASLNRCGDYHHWILLYSSTQASYSGRFSYLAYIIRECIEGDSFDTLAPKLSSSAPHFTNAWFGYFGYGLKDELERLPPDTPNWLHMPALCLMRFGVVLVFDHVQRTLTLYTDSPNPYIPQSTKSLTTPNIHVASLRSNMSNQDYRAKVQHIRDHIHAGRLYQANLTRKFIGNFTQATDDFALFARLCKLSPAPYSAFCHLDGIDILSSSPELFLRIGADSSVEARPIKGTRPRHADGHVDSRARADLLQSAKDRAENLMIADLMRNDLSRVCWPGSVTTSQLFEVTSHAQVHHMSSTVKGVKRQDCTTLEAIRCCFPPGSMTGAPKIEAMKLCSELEQLERGIYSGAIGFLGGDGACELSVVIRTLLIRDSQFEFQVGGGIVADSTPEAELQESFDKARGILAALGLQTSILHSL